jgi:hypothetical protein
MCKAIDKRMVIEDIHLCEKTGGKSGHFQFDEQGASSCETGSRDDNADGGVQENGKELSLW